MITARTGLRHLHNLVSHVLIAVSVIQAQTVVEETEVDTRLDVLGVLRLQVLIVCDEIRHESGHAIIRIEQRISHIHSAAVARRVEEVVHITSCLSHLCERSADFSERKHGVVVERRELRENPRKRNRRIEEAACSARHRRQPVVTPRNRQVEHVFPREVRASEHTNHSLGVCSLLRGERSGVADGRHAVESEARTLISPVALLLVVDFVAEHNIQSPLVVAAKACRQVGCDKVVERVVGHALVQNVAAAVACRAHLIDLAVVVGIDIETGLLAHEECNRLVLYLRTVFQISVAEHTVGVLQVLIVFRPPVRIVERSGTEKHLRSRVARKMRRHAFQVVFGRSGINHVHDTRVSARSRINLCARVVYRETCLQHVVDCPVNQSARSPAVHTGRGNHAVLMGVAEAERITCLAGILRNVDSGILCEAGIEEIAYVVVYRRTYPSRAVAISCAGVCRVIVHSIVSVAVAAVIRVIGQLADFRTPSSGVGGAV